MWLKSLVLGLTLCQRRLPGRFSGEFSTSRIAFNCYFNMAL